MTAVPWSFASASTSAVGAMPLEATTSAAPSWIARSCASGRSPMTTTSPASMPVGDRTSRANTHTRPSTSPFPVSTSPSSMSAIACTDVGVSTRLDVSRDSRM